MNVFERYTDRARKVMALANQEAQRFNHEYIGTEHILLGLVKEGSGVGANVLKNLDVDLRKVRLEVEMLVKSGPDMVTMGKLPQTPRTKRAIEFAILEANALHHNYIGTEHILLGLLKEQDGVASQVLMNLGLKLEDVREEVLNLIGAGKHRDSEHEYGGGNLRKPSQPLQKLIPPNSWSYSSGSPSTSYSSPSYGSQIPVAAQSAFDTEVPQGDTDATTIGIQIGQLQSRYDAAVQNGDNEAAGRLAKEIERLDGMTTEVAPKTSQDEFKATMKAVDKALAKLLVVVTEPETILEDIDLSRTRIDGALILVREFLEYQKSTNVDRHTS